MPGVFQRILSHCFLLGLALCCSVLAAEAAEAEKPKKLIPGPAITPTAWPGGTSIPTGKLSVVDHVSFSHGEMRQGTGSYSSSKGPESNDLTTNIFKLRYGIAWNRLDIRTSTPFVNNDIARHSPQAGTWKGGWGDTTVMMRYQVLPMSKELPVCVAVDAGVILPTGTVGDKNKYTATNAFGMVFGGGASWIDYDQRVDVDARYVVYEEGAHDIRPADYFLSHIHYAYALSPYFDLGAEGWIKVAEESEVAGKAQKDSFTEAYAGPKIQFKIPEWNNLMIGAAALFPAYRYYEKAQLSPDVRYETRIGLMF